MGWSGPVVLPYLLSGDLTCPRDLFTWLEQIGQLFQGWDIGSCCVFGHGVFGQGAVSRSTMDMFPGRSGRDSSRCEFDGLVTVDTYGYVLTPKKWSEDIVSVWNGLNDQEPSHLRLPEKLWKTHFREVRMISCVLSKQELQETQNRACNGPLVILPHPCWFLREGLLSNMSITELGTVRVEGKEYSRQFTLQC